MQESHGKGSASHPDPKSCGGVREGAAEALTGAHAGQPSSCEITPSGVPTPSSKAEGNTIGGAIREPSEDPAQSQTLSMRGNSLHGNREIPRVPVGHGPAGRPEKAVGRTSGTHAPGKSDDRVVPETATNQKVDYWTFWERHSALLREIHDLEEKARGRRSTEGNAEQAATVRTQSRAAVPIGLQRVREVARRDRRARFTHLLHHVTADLLRASFYALKRNAVPGVDGLTWRQYEEGLKDRLVDLHRQVHQGTYRALPSKRAYIPKPDGRMRPLGIAALEDKIVQQALLTVLNAIYEADFLGFSYGFRPGCGPHDALDALWVGIMRKKVNWVLDADIRSFFDTIDHGWMLKFLEHRIGDPRVLRLIRKWLSAGVCEDGTWSKVVVGTPQGSVISPLLANVYLHYALDLWVQQWRSRQARGDVIIVRYADDFVMGFQHRHAAERFLTDLRARMEEFGLALHPEKTRLIEFGRFAAENRRKREGRKPETFQFLGFEHLCGKGHWNGGFNVKRQSSPKRLRAKLQAVKQAMMANRHRPVPEQGAWLRAVVQGYLNYHAVPGNMRALATFRREAVRRWLHALRRRSQRHRMPWDRFGKIAERWITHAKISHPYPNVRFNAKHPK